MSFTVTDKKELADLQDAVFDAVHPVGEIYIQYPHKKDPQTLYGRGSWKNVSNEFAGLFFRAEGGNAEPFNAAGVTIQEDKIRPIKGTAGSVWANVQSSGAFTHTYVSSVSLQQDDGFSTYRFNFDANTDKNSDGTNEMAGHADGPEIRPVNTTIRIWEREA